MVYRVSATFKGKVQGVYFRQYTRRWAEMLSLSGYVKNMPDGTVLAVFEGQRQAIQEMIRRLKEEHPNAEVTSVDIKVEEPEGLQGFQIMN
ncbi:MAG TPA: acylphosphatase [Methanomassiliicoccales archaeon]|jgi:acylphosphatase|nr:acylphosphatase [Methanomassiliicoccales archaeon]